jgi:hypothetical protein
MTCGIIGLVIAARPSHARIVGQDMPLAEAEVSDTAPLIEWDLPDMMAQQQPTTPPATTPEPPPAATETAPVDPDTPPEGATVEDDFSIGDIPEVETIELTLDKARKALDTYALVREKYKDAALENYENLQDFVDQSAQGKAFEQDVKLAGFATVTEWNTTITTLSFANDNAINDQTKDIEQQIKELETDTTVAEDMRQRMITTLKAMIPSENNKKVIDDLRKDTAAAEKLKLLETEAE